MYISSKAEQQLFSMLPFSYCFPVLFSAPLPAQSGERAVGPGQCDRCSGLVPPHPGDGRFLLHFLLILCWL